MLTITSVFSPAAAMNNIKARGFGFNTTTLAAYIRHNCTNYDSVCNALSTDAAEAFILETVALITSISPATKGAMITWGQKKGGTLA